MAAGQVQQYRGANTLHQAGIPDRMHMVRTLNSPSLPNAPSARPRAFPLAPSAESRPSRSGPAFGHASGLDIAPPQDYGSPTLPLADNSPLASLQPAPLFSRPLHSAQGSIDAAMNSTKASASAGGARATSGSPNVGATAKPLVGGSSPEIDATVQAHLELRRSVCQSPSWEAYTQRKQEKKGAKKEKEPRSKEIKPRTRRLSKPPPSSPTLTPRSHPQAQSEHNISKAPTSRHQSRDRSRTVLGLIGAPQEETPPRAPRSRSSSLSSLFRSTFDIRRPSLDLSLDTGFIGGIKLEQHRDAAEDDQAIEDANQAKAEELGIHPALRPEKSQHRTDPIATGSPAGPRNRYPPNSMRTSPYATTQALVSPSAPQNPELSTMNRWRARVGLRAKPGNEKNNGGMPARKPVPLPAGQLTSNAGARVSSPALLTSARLSLDLPQYSRQGRSSTTELPTLTTGPEYSHSPPPPSPPRKSSKRKSLIIMDSPSSLKSGSARLESADKNPNAYANVPAGAAPRRASIDAPDSKSGNWSGQKRSFKEAARAALGKVPTRPNISVLQSNKSEGPSSSATRESSRPPTSSSAGSLSDEYHSAASAHTDTTTPDTSRPQSEKGFFSIAPKIGLGSDKKKAASRRSETASVGTSASRVTPEAEMDPIQAAAQKVRAAFPEPSTRPMSFDRRTQSDTNGSVPRLRHPTLKPADRSRVKVNRNSESYEDDDRSPALRDMILSKDQSSVSAPWPASYLEAARKAAPSAPVPRNKPTGFPSPSLSTLNSGVAPPSPRSPLLPLINPDANNSGGASSPVKTSSSSFTGSASGTSAATVGSSNSGEPLAKMFVECCGCRYYHDMPSKLYEAMSNPEGALGGPGEFAHPSVVCMTVRCPWCQHDMSTKCCAGLAAMVYVKERLH